MCTSGGAQSLPKMGWSIEKHYLCVNFYVSKNSMRGYTGQYLGPMMGKGYWYLPLWTIPRRYRQYQYWYWVNPSIRGGMDGVFRWLAGLLRGISRGQSPREIPRSSPASPRQTPPIHTLLLGFTFYLKKDILIIFVIFFYKYSCLKKHNSR